jgi:hypothetical protein
MEYPTNAGQQLESGSPSSFRQARHYPSLTIQIHSLPFVHNNLYLLGESIVLLHVMSY